MRLVGAPGALGYRLREGDRVVIGVAAPQKPARRSWTILLISSG